jgi:hypothetical protein
MREVAERISINHDGWAETVDKWWHGIGDWVA